MLCCKLNCAGAGDGLRVGAEKCDDKNLKSGDGCSSTCLIECGFTCDRQTSPLPDKCYTKCGDGVKSSVEECDDGNTISNDGCSLNCTLETQNFACLPLPCSTTTCEDYTKILTCANGTEEVADLRMQQAEAGRTKTLWSHHALVVVTVFQIQCVLGNSSESPVYNVSTLSCSGFMCQKDQENIQPGVMLTCSVRALVDPCGWSGWKSASITVVGRPSSPLNPTISHSRTLDSCITVWSLTWSGPLDYGDQKSPESLNRVELSGYDVRVFCGIKTQNISVGQVLKLNLQAVWKCSGETTDCTEISVPAEFRLKFSDFPGFSLDCRRGETVSFKSRAKNFLSAGEWSAPASLKAMGLPAPVINLQVIDLSEILNVVWTQVQHYN